MKIAIITMAVLAAAAAAPAQTAPADSTDSAPVPASTSSPAASHPAPVELSLPVARWATSASAPATSKSLSASALAGRSLLNSAMDLVYAPAGTPARAARLVALSRYAEKLLGDDPRDAWLLSNIYETQGRFAEAAEEVSRYLRSYPQDYTGSVRWLGLRLGAADSARERLALLRAVSEQADVPAPVRAEAAAQMGQLLAGSGEKAKAGEAYRLALKLDPLQPVALNAELTNQDGASPADQAAVMLKLIRGNPTAVRVEWDLGVFLGSLGLYEQALAMLDSAWQITVARTGADRVSQAFIVQYASAMLDAGKADKAVEFLAPMAKRYFENADLRVMLIEAYKDAGDQRSVREQRKSLEGLYISKESSTTATAASYMELAWFYTVTVPRPPSALEYARQAAKLAPEDPIVQRVLGAALIATDKPEEGEKLLAPLADKDIYAAVFLAEHYYAAGNAEAGRKALLAGAAITRGGPGFRHLLELAKKHKVVMPPAKGSEETLEVLKAVAEGQYMDMGLAPQKHIEVTLRPRKEKVSPSEPVEIEATLTNIGPVDVPLGQWGLLSPAMSLQVELTGGVSGTFSSLPLVTWPAPHYLGPGRSVTTVLRIDVGELGTSLDRLPLEAITLKVTGVLDPLQQGENFISSLPSVPVQPATIERTSLLGEFDGATAGGWKEAYTNAIKQLVADIKSDSLDTRILAARRVGSLCAFALLAEQQKAKLPEQLLGVVTMRIPLAMVQTMAADPSDAVRAELVVALANAPVDDRLLKLLAPLVGDPSPLVRLRVAEFVGVSGTRGRQAILNHLAEDENEFVRLVATGLLAK